MIFLGLSSLLCVLKFRKISHKPFTPAWFTWLRYGKNISPVIIMIIMIVIITHIMKIKILQVIVLPVIPSVRQKLSVASSSSKSLHATICTVQPLWRSCCRCFLRQVHWDLHWIPCYLPFDSGNHDYEVDDNYDDDDNHDDDSDNYDYGDEDEVKCVDDDYHHPGFLATTTEQVSD